MQDLRNRYIDQKGKTNTKSSISLIQAARLIIISIGAVSLTVSVVLVSQILAFLGLGLVLWGFILFYIQPEEGTKIALLNASILTTYGTLKEIINEFGYKA